MVSKRMLEDIWNQKCEIYQEALTHIANDFHHGMITFTQFEKDKKQLQRDVFGDMKNPHC